MLGISCACGIPIAEKIRSLQLHPNATPSRPKRKYWDQEALHQTFGEDARDRVMETTGGKGYDSAVTLVDLFND
jgi:hypothetical protein